MPDVDYKVFQVADHPILDVGDACDAIRPVDVLLRFGRFVFDPFGVQGVSDVVLGLYEVVFYTHDVVLGKCQAVVGA